MVSRIANSKRWTRWTTGAGAAIAVLSSAGTVWSAPITFNTALPVAEGEFVVREQFVLEQSDDDPSSADPGRVLPGLFQTPNLGFEFSFAAPCARERGRLPREAYRRQHLPQENTAIDQLRPRSGCFCAELS